MGLERNCRSSWWVAEEVPGLGPGWGLAKQPEEQTLTGPL